MYEEKAEREGERVGKRKGKSDGGVGRGGIGDRGGREGRREDGLLAETTFWAMAIMLNPSIYMKPSH